MSFDSMSMSGLTSPTLGEFRTQSESSTSSAEYLSDVDETVNHAAQAPLRTIATIGTGGSYRPRTVTKQYNSNRDKCLEISILSRLLGVHRPQVVLEGNLESCHIETSTNQNLLSYLNTGPLSFTQLQSMGGQMANVLTNLHKKGYVHTQVNPLNIGIQPPHYFELLNFEHSAKIGDSPRQFDLSGTEHPSLMLGDKASPNHDVFAFGVTLYRVLTNKPSVEFSDENIRKVLDAHPVFNVIREEEKKNNLMKAFLLLHAYQRSFGEFSDSLIRSIYENSQFFTPFDLGCIFKKTDSDNYKLIDLEADIEFANWEEEIKAKLDRNKANELIRVIKNSCSFSESDKSIRIILENQFLTDIISDDNINKVIGSCSSVSSIDNEESKILMAKTFLYLHACRKYLGNIPNYVFQLLGKDPNFEKEFFRCFLTQNIRGKYHLNKLSSDITLPEKEAELIETFKSEVLNLKRPATANDLAKDPFFRNGIISFTLAFTETLEKYSDQGNRLVIYDENDPENFVAIDLEGDVYREELRLSSNGASFKYQIFKLDNKEVLSESTLNIGNLGTVRI